jgi:hypothetical protein
VTVEIGCCFLLLYVSDDGSEPISLALLVTLFRSYFGGDLGSAALKGTGPYLDKVGGSFFQIIFGDLGSAALKVRSYFQPDQDPSL